MMDNVIAWEYVRYRMNRRARDQEDGMVKSHDEYIDKVLPVSLIILKGLERALRDCED